jgi:hypothetical protein
LLVPVLWTAGPNLDAVEIDFADRFAIAIADIPVIFVKPISFPNVAVRISPSLIARELRP